MQKTNLFESSIFKMAVLFVLVLTAYSFGLKAGFSSLDDETSIVNNERLRDVSRFGEMFSSGFFNDTHFYRPMVEVSFGIEYQLFKLDPFFYHLNNILLHFVNSLLVFVLMKMIMRNVHSAFFAAVLFAIHPIQSEPIVNIAGRSILLSSFFVLISFITFVYLRQRRFKIFFYFISIGAFLAALMCKESAAMLPILFLSYAWFIDRKRGESVLVSMLSVAPYIIVLYFFVQFRKILGITDLYPWQDVSSLILGFTSFLRGVLTYLKLYIYPVGLYFDRSQEIFISFFQPQVIITWFIWMTAFITVFKLRRKFSNEAWFFLSWFAIELIPVSQIVTTIGVSPGFISLAEHFCYVASIGIFGLTAISLQQIFESKKISQNLMKIISGGFLIFIYLITIEQATYAGNITAMFQRSAAHNPYNGRVIFNLGLELAKEGKFAEAELNFRKGLALDPRRLKIQIALGKSLCDQGKWIECIQEYKKIEDPGKNRDLLNENMRLTYEIIFREAQALEKNGRLQEALKYYQEYVSGGGIHAAIARDRLSVIQHKQE